MVIDGRTWVVPTVIESGGRNPATTCLVSTSQSLSRILAPTVISNYQGRNRPVPVDVVEKLREFQGPWPNEADLQRVSTALFQSESAHFFSYGEYGVIHKKDQSRCRKVARDPHILDDLYLDIYHE